MTNHASPQREAQKPSAFLSGAERASNPVRAYEFDRFRIDTKRSLLTRDGEPVAIKAKALDTLVLLVQHAGRLLEKEELMNGLWPDTAVEEANLTQNIFEVRKALGEVPGEQRFIATVARRGYRFVAEVRAIGDEASARDDLAAGDRHSKAPLVGHERFARRTVIYAGVAAAIVLSLLGTGLYVASRRSAPGVAGTSSSPARNLTRLTYGAGLQTDVSWSPDGRWVAYAWDRDGNFDIWVQNVDAGQPTRVTSSAANETQPAWSPDGQRLVFRSEDDGGGLFTIDVKGGPVRRIAPDGRRPAWMPNGREVVFVDSDSPHAAFIVAADGGEAPRRILETELSRTIWAASAIHPEGRISVIDRDRFFVADRTHSRLNAVDTSAAEPLGLLDPDVIRNISWNPAGTALIVEALSDGVPTLWRVPVEPVSLRWGTPERLTTAPASAEGAAVSPDGTRVTFTSAQASSRAWLFPFDANSAQLMGNGQALTAEDLVLVSLSLARDGAALCYGAREVGRNEFQLFYTDLTTGGTTLVGEAWGGVISRTGRRVVYPLTRTVPSSTGENPSAGREHALAIRDLDGRERLASRWGRGGLLPHDWAPDDEAILGSWLEQHNREMNQNVLVIWPIGPMLATRPERGLLESSGVNFWQARYSPDNRWVSFVAQRMRNPGTVEIGIAAAGSNRATTWTRILEDHVWPDKPRWSPDGRTLYFLSRGADGYFNLWGVPIDPARGAQTGKPFQVTHFSSPDWHIDSFMGNAEIGLASGKLVLPMQSVKGSIWLLSGVSP